MGNTFFFPQSTENYRNFFSNCVIWWVFFLTIPRMQQLLSQSLVQMQFNDKLTEQLSNLERSVMTCQMALEQVHHKIDTMGKLQDSLHHGSLFKTWNFSVFSQKLFSYKLIKKPNSDFLVCWSGIIFPFVFIYLMIQLVAWPLCLIIWFDLNRSQETSRHGEDHHSPHGKSGIPVPWYHCGEIPRLWQVHQLGGKEVLYFV